VLITGEGLKTLDAVRGSFETHEIEPSVAAFERDVEQASVAIGA
jgi:threonine synthase